MFAKIPVGSWIQSGVAEVTTRFEPQFRWVSDSMSGVLGGVIQALASVPPVALAGLLVALVLLSSRSLKKTFASVAGLFLILNLGYWQETLETVALVLFSTLFAVSMGVPVGIFCAHRPRLMKWVEPILDLMQTIPTFVYLIPTLMLFGLGLAPGVISTVIFSMPAPIRLTFLGIHQVPKALSEVGEAFGATPWQRLRTIELPCAMQTIRTGISQCIMLSLSMVVIAALVGAEGLGKPVVQALNTVNIAKGFEAGLVIVIVAVFMDRMLNQKTEPASRSAAA